MNGRALGTPPRRGPTAPSHAIGYSCSTWLFATLSSNHGSYTFHSAARTDTLEDICSGSSHNISDSRVTSPLKRQSRHHIQILLWLSLQSRYWISRRPDQKILSQNSCGNSGMPYYMSDSCTLRMPGSIRISMTEFAKKALSSLTFPRKRNSELR